MKIMNNTPSLLKQLSWLIIFSIAMAYLESAVVVYLREIYYPDGFSFPLTPINAYIFITEFWREIATIIMLAGIGVLTDEIVDNLQFLQNLALSFIALTAGGELKFKQVKAYKKSLAYILFSQMIIIFLGMVVVFYFIADYIPFFSGLNNFMILGLAILFAGTSLSTSPATAIGIITELQSEGKVTNIVFISVGVIIFFFITV